MNRALIILLCLVISTQANSQDRDNYELLWRFSNDQGQSGYLLGTMHINSDRVYDFSDSVLVCLENSDIAAFEIDLSLMQDLIADEIAESLERELGFKALFEEDDDDSRDYLELDEESFSIPMPSEESQNRSERSMKREMYRRDLVRDQAAEHHTFLDSYLYEYADRKGVRMAGLEDFEEHMAIGNMPTKLDSALQNKLDSIFKSADFEAIADTISLFRSKTDSIPPPPSPTSELEKLVEVLNNRDNDSLHLEKLREIKQRNEDFINMYWRGNLEEIQAFSESEFFSRGSDPFQLIDRNYIMVNSIDSLSKEGVLFAAVGCAHLPGEEGVIELLRKEGFTLTPVEASFTGVAVAKQKEFEIQRFSEEFPAGTSGYVLHVPNKPSPIENNTYMAMDMFVSYDQLRQNVYMFGPMGMGLDRSQFDVILSLSSDEMGGSSPFMNIISDEIINTKYGKCREIKGTLMSNALIYRYAYIGNRLVVFMAFGPSFMALDSEGTELFLNEVRFDPSLVERKVTEYSMFEDLEGGYRLNMPPIAFNDVMETPSDDEMGGYSGYDPYKMHIATGVDYNNGLTAFVRYHDIPPGLASWDIETTMSSNLDDFRNDPEAEVTKETVDTIFVNGHKTLKMVLEYDTEEYLEAWVTARGYRTYLMMIVYTEQSRPEAEAIAKSYEILPFQASDWTEYSNDRFDLTFTDEMRQVESDTAGFWEIFPVENYSLWSGLDEKTSSQVNVYRYQLNQNFMVEDPHRLFDDFIQESMEEGDSATIALDTLMNGYPVRMQKRIRPNHNVIEHEFIAFEGDELYNLVHTYPMELESDTVSDALFSSFLIKTFEENGELTGSFENIIDLIDGDSVDVVTEGASLLQYWQLDSTHLSELSRVFLKELPFEESDWSWQPNDKHVFNAIASIDSSTLFNLCLEKIKHSEIEKTQWNWIKEVVPLAENESEIDLILQAMNNLELNYEASWAWYFDDHAEYLLNNPEKIENLISSYYFRSDLFSLLTWNREVKHIELTAMLELYIDIHIDSLYHRLRKHEMNPEEFPFWTFSSSASTLAEILRDHKPNDKRVEFLSDFMGQEYFWEGQVMHFKATQYVFGGKLKKKEWRAYAKNGPTRFEAIKLLKELGQENLIDESYYTREASYLALLVNYMNDEDYVEDVELLREFTLDGEDYYFVKAVGDYAYYVILGPVPQELFQENDFWEKIYYSWLWKEGATDEEHLEYILTENMELDAETIESILAQ